MNYGVSQGTLQAPESCCGKGTRVPSETENRLKDSISPYLRSAAHQPIDWYEWGDAAFARAKSEDKPVLLDIGAVWCHWCHVIDRESYENADIARIINEHFVAVKVDRDERPDVDSRYQSAISALSGQGGWPLTGFLLPDGKPFYGGTYFPPDDQGGRPGFRRVLMAVSDSFRNKRADLERAANSLADAVAQAEMFTGAHAGFDLSILDAQVQSITKLFDSRNGGFGQSPKFSHPSAIDLLLERYQQTKDKQLLAIAETSLEKMARGGVYDQLAGGFHRYSVDERWLVPHFEKMSYDNSELLRNYLHGWQVTQNPFLRETAEGIIGWVNEVLSDQRSGGFYASQDADYCLEDDGDYFTWTVDEVREVPRSSRTARCTTIRRKMSCGWRATPRALQQQATTKRRCVSRLPAPKARCSPAVSGASRRTSTPPCTSPGMPCLFPRTWMRAAFSAARREKTAATSR